MKSKLKFILKFFAFALLFFILSRASVNALIYPFAFAMLFALAWANQEVWILLPSYLLGSIVNHYDFQSIISIFITLLFLALPYFIHVSVKKPMHKWELFCYAFLSQTAWIVFELLKGEWVIVPVTIVTGLAYLYLCLTIFEPLISRGINYKLTLPEIVSGGVILLSVAAGLDNITLYGFSFLKFFVAFLILVLSYTSSPGRTVIFASLMGLGSLISSNNPYMVAPFIVWALAAISFKFLNRLLPAVAIVLAELVSTFYFNLYYSFSIPAFLPVVLASVIFLILPAKFYSSLSILLSTRKERSGIKSLLNRNRDIMQRRLEKLSEVFFDMNIVFRRLIKQEASGEEIKDMLCDEIISSICKGCPEQKHCHRTFSEDTRNLFKNLITISMERGKITLLDIPSYLTSRCRQTSRLISEINSLAKQYISYSQLVSNVDTSKLLISDQLEGISHLMKALSGEVDTMISMDAVREGKIIEELSSNNIICTDAVVYEKDMRTMMATLVVRDEDVNKLKLQNVVSKICGRQMVIYDVYPTEQAGMVCVNLKTAPRFDCVFGIECVPKSGKNISGDRHCVERLDGDKFIFAICDGMGSGESAGEKADTAVSLIENFYKAGFESDIILSSVNKLMNLERDDIFSTIDIVIVDLKDGIADFIKMGASSSYVRGEEGCTIIESSSLPVGIVDEARAITKKLVLKEKDYIIICSDGINDSFGKDGEFKDFLLTIKSQNPQEMATEILKKALSQNNGYAVDDMTVIVIKIF